MNPQKNKNQVSPIAGLIMSAIIILLLVSLVRCAASSSSKSGSSGSVRCYYCSKVIYNNGRAIHATHKMGNTYVCDYCGWENVIR